MLISFVDLETTGLHAETHEIIEVGLVKAHIDGANLVLTKIIDEKVLPEMPVDPRVAKINGYNEEEWALYGDYIATVLPELFEEMEGTWHAGSNPRFDEAFLKNYANRFRWSYPKLSSYHLLDVTAQALPLLLQGKIEKLKQENVAEYYGISGGGHRAFSDALQCAEIFAVLNNLIVVKDWS